MGEALIDVLRPQEDEWCLMPIENHGARATCKGTFVVRQISLLKLQTCIHYDFGPKAMLSNAGL